MHKQEVTYGEHVVISCTNQNQSHKVKMDFEKAVHSVLKDLKLNIELSTPQMQALQVILQCGNVFAVLPTGSGKSMIFCLLSFILKKIYDRETITLVISPTKSLIFDQVASCQKMGINATACYNVHDMDQRSTKAIEKGTSTIIFATPEAATSTFFKTSLRKWKEKVCALFIDEAHALTHWGLEFRTDYLKVTSLRCFLSDAPVVCLTATCTAEMMQGIFNVLKMRKEDFSIIAKLPDRPEIHLNIEIASEFYEEELKSHFKGIMEKGTSSEQTIIYVKTITLASEMYGHIQDILGDEHERPYADAEDLVEMYHGSLTSEDQERITESFVKEDSLTKCVICTEGFGFGINSKSVRTVILWGAPKDILTMWQQIGRCARDGKPGEVFVHLFPNATRNCDSKMKEMCQLLKQGKCIRKLILSYLFIDGMSQDEFDKCNQGHCCNNCDLKSVCDRD